MGAFTGGLAQLAYGDLPLGWIALAILAFVALYDGFTSYVPPWPLALLSLAAMACGIAMGGGETMALRAWAALGFYLLVLIVNEIWYRRHGMDALGMGDATWSGAAILSFGLPILLVAWGVGAWLALFWMGGARLLRRASGAPEKASVEARAEDMLAAPHVYFLPFVLAGLLAALALRLG